MTPTVTGFFDTATRTISYVVRDPDSDSCAIIDPVLDYDPKSGRTSTDSADQVIEYIRSNGLSVQWILETHVHADHLTAAPYLQETLGGKTAIGNLVTRVQEVFTTIFNLPGVRCDGSQFDKLLADGDEIGIGTLPLRALHTPGHTLACMTYLVGDAAFVGDTLFMPDYGTARCDFPGGDAATLYRSIQKLFALPARTRLYLCHDYLTEQRLEHRWETSVAEQRAHNIHVHDGVSENDFVRFRNERDAQLQMPELIIPSVQVNMRAGQMPEPEDNGTRYLKVPLNTL